MAAVEQVNLGRTSQSDQNYQEQSALFQTVKAL